MKKIKTARVAILVGFVAASILASFVCVARGDDATNESAQRSEIQKEEIRIKGSLGSLYGVLHLPQTDGRLPLIVLSHGFGCNHFATEHYAEYFAREGGFATFNFDFCGGGKEIQSDGSLLEFSVLTEAQDLNAVVDHFLKDPRFDRIFLFGQSQGGFVSALVASQRPQDVDAVVLEYPAFVIQDDAKKRANSDGTFPETVDVFGVTIGRKYNEDAVSFDIYEELGKYSGDVLIMHGDKDGIVPLRYAERAAKIYKSAELVVMPGQGHGFWGAAFLDAAQRELKFFQSRAKK